ncbi:N-alpha-acetyltransferase RimI [Metarhizium anisopliae]|nr:N-alpha-acetyltransferase RimI [Metarhizium anisopliae]
MEYQFVRVDPSDPNLPSLAAQYKRLRLEALKQSPHSFSSTYETESQFPDDVWVSRLQHPRKETFICVATLEGESEWVAQVTLRGPLSAEEFHLSESGQPPAAPDEEEEKWQMLSLYNLPSHRGKGLGKRLCKAACDFVVSRGGVSPTITVRCMVKPDNLATLGMYQSLGFERTGFCTLEEALRANGDADMIPEGVLEKKFTTRTGITLALHLGREN